MRVPHIVPFVAAMLAAPISLAMTPVPDEAFLCNSTHVVIGTVLKATRIPWGKQLEDACRDEPWHCPGASSCQSDPHLIYLKIRVDAVLATTAAKTMTPPPPYTGIKLKTVTAGETIDVATDLFNDACGSTGYDGSGILAVNPPEKGPSPTKSVSPKLLRRVYVGKQFVFPLTAVRLIGHDPNASPPYSVTQPYNTYTFRMERRPWIVASLKRMAGKSCPRLVTAPEQ